ncbi:tryptophan ABC transporter substrate-binding protein [Weissella halotolerans]|nr:tryptophan ABC transporter substrate-binding protein [Weissella halotolerans]
MDKKIMSVLAALALFLGVAGFFEQHAQDKKTMPEVGILQFTSHPALDQIHAGIIDALQAAGYQPGKNIKIDFQNAQGDQSNLKTMATKFANGQTDLAVGIATPAAVALANTIQDNPVLFSASTNPIQAKLVKSYQHPGSNVTGVTDQAPLADQLKMIQAFVPHLKRLGVIYTSSDDSAVSEARAMVKLAQQAGVTVKEYTITSSNDLNQTAEQMVSHQQVEAVFVPTDNTIAAAMPTLIKNTDAAGVPVFPTVDTMVAAGGVAAESINQREIGRLTGKMMVKILKGASPKDLPVDFIEKGTLVVNRSQLERLHMQLPAGYQQAKFIDQGE